MLTQHRSHWLGSPKRRSIFLDDNYFFVLEVLELEPLVVVVTGTMVGVGSMPEGRSSTQVRPGAMGTNLPDLS